MKRIMWHTPVTCLRLQRSTLGLSSPKDLWSHPAARKALPSTLGWNVTIFTKLCLCRGRQEVATLLATVFSSAGVQVAHQ